MTFDANYLLASFFVSSVGLVLFMYGKRMARVPQLAVGLVLLVYPYFLTSIGVLFAIAALLLALMGLAIQRGL
jgi:hypothetical protein